MSDTLYMTHKDTWINLWALPGTLWMTTSEIFKPCILEFGSKIQNQVPGSLPLYLSNGKSWAMIKALSHPHWPGQALLLTSHVKTGYFWCSLSPDSVYAQKQWLLGSFHVRKKVWSKQEVWWYFASLWPYNLHVAFNFRWAFCLVIVKNNKPLLVSISNCISHFFIVVTKYLIGAT